MFNRQYGDPNISKLLQLVVNTVQVKGIKFVLISLLANIDLHSQSQCVLLTYPF